MTIDHDSLGYAANLITSWIPSLDGVRDRLETGMPVADLGCGHGSSTVLMALAYPASTYRGFDHDQQSIGHARKRAAEAGVAVRCRFEATAATAYPGVGYGLVTSYGCLHDADDPAGAAAHVRASLAPDGAWLLVEPAGDGEVTRKAVIAAGFTRMRLAERTTLRNVFDVRP
jgi:trans-aconitate methyltransferase